MAPVRPSSNERIVVPAPVELSSVGAANVSLQPFFNSIAVAPACLELLAVGKSKEELTVVQGNEFSDSGSLHDG